MTSSSRSGRVTPSRSVQVPRGELGDGGADRVDLRARDLGVAGVRHLHEMRARLGPAGSGDALAGGVGVAREPALVDLVRDEAAELGVHPPGDGQQDAAVGRHRRVLAEQPVEAGEPGIPRMRALHHLRQLARVADQHDVAGASPHRQQVGEPDLPRLVDDQRVEGALELRPAEKEGGAADDIGVAQRRGVVPRNPLDRAVVIVGIAADADLVGQLHMLERQPGRVVGQRGEAAAQQVRDRLVAGRGDRHPPPGRDQREDGASGGAGLAGARRSLDRQHRVLHREDRPHRARDRVIAAEDVGPGPAVEPRSPAREQVVEGAMPPLPALVGDGRPHPRGEDARVERRRRMQRQPVGQGRRLCWCRA